MQINHLWSYLWKQYSNDNEIFFHEQSVSIACSVNFCLFFGGGVIKTFHLFFLSVHFCCNIFPAWKFHLTFCFCFCFYIFVNNHISEKSIGFSFCWTIIFTFWLAVHKTLTSYSVHSSHTFVSFTGRVSLCQESLVKLKGFFLIPAMFK